MRRRKPVHTRRAAPVQPAPERRMNVPEPESRRDIRLFWKRGRYKTRAMEAFLAMPPENGGEG